MDKGWQPIETAPRDGTPILVYENYGKGVVMTVMVAVKGNFPGDGWLWNPTHWMPLPEPPDGAVLKKTVVTNLGVRRIETVVEFDDDGKRIVNIEVPDGSP